MKRQIKYLFLFFLILVPLVYLHAQEGPSLNEASLTITARDSNGDFIPNINLEISEEIIDVDGNPKPGKVVASGKIDPITGMFKKSFKDNDPEADLSGRRYAIRMWDKNKNAGSFYFYGDAVLVGGSDVMVTEVLSSLDVIIRDTNKNLIKNKKFNIYSEREDADGNPIKEKQDLIGSFDTSSEGEVVIYIPNGERAIGGDGSDYYILEMNGPEGGIYIDYGNRISDSQNHKLEYTLSDVELLLKNASNVPYPGGTKINFYYQSEDVDGKLILGDKIKDLTCDDDGRIVFTYPRGSYAAQIDGADGQYQNFWNIDIRDEKRTSYTLKTEEQWEAIDETCDLSSKITLVAMDLKGKHIPGLHFAFYEEKLDVNGIKTYGEKLVDGVIGDLGEAEVNVHPNPLKKYALKIYDKNANVGDFWYYDGLQFICGEDAYIEKKIPALKIILRDVNYNLIKKQPFAIYTQKHDADGNPIKEKKDLVSSKLNTGEKGEFVIYLAPDNIYDQEKRGTYVLNAAQNRIFFDEYNIVIDPLNDQTLEYIFSTLVVIYKNGIGQVVQNKNVSLYKMEKSSSGSYVLGKKALNKKSNQDGIVDFQYPSGKYALVLKDSLGHNNIFWNIMIKNRQKTEKEIKENMTRVSIKGLDGSIKLKNTAFTVFSMKENEDGTFSKNKKEKVFKIGENNYLDLSLSPGPYLFTYIENKKEYGVAIYTENGKKQDALIKVSDTFLVSGSKKYKLRKPEPVRTLSQKLKGYILLQVEEKGEAWYVDDNTDKRYYMKDGEIAYEMLRKFGLGITTEDLDKIPVGIDKRFETYDYDGDGVFDKMEEALGTDMYSSDTDGDSYLDGTELLNDFNPKGAGMLSLDLSLADKLKGKILLQVENRGEAWYVNPEDGRRYYMPDGEAAYEIMRFLSLGITNENLDLIEEGSLSDEELEE